MTVEIKTKWRKAVIENYFVIIFKWSYCAQTIRTKSIILVINSYHLSKKPYKKSNKKQEKKGKKIQDNRYTFSHLYLVL